MEDLNYYIESAKEHMEKSLSHVKHALGKIRAGRAHPNMLEDITVDYYGNPTPINQVASVNTPDAKSLMIKPWEKKLLKEIETAIINSDLGLNPQNDGELIRLNVPALTEERRKELVKQAKNESEHGKVSIRNVRKDANEHIKKLKKEHVSEDEIKIAEQKIQDLTNDFISKIDVLVEEKEKEIMHV